jgi:hypothetical protein
MNTCRDYDIGHFKHLLYLGVNYTISMREININFTVKDVSGSLINMFQFELGL